MILGPGRVWVNLLTIEGLQKKPGEKYVQILGFFYMEIPKLHQTTMEKLRRVESNLKLSAGPTE